MGTVPAPPPAPFDLAPQARFPMLMLSALPHAVFSLREPAHLTLWNAASLRLRVLDGATFVLPSLATFRVVRTEKIGPRPPFLGWTLWDGRVWRMRFLVEDTGVRTLADVRRLVLAKLREDEDHEGWQPEDIRAVEEAPTFEAICLALPAKA